MTVLLPLPFAAAFDYRLPDRMDAAPGSIVVVTLNGRELLGVVWDDAPDPTMPAARLKSVQATIPEFRIASTLRQFIDWVAGYTLSYRGEVLAMSLRPQALTPDRVTWKVCAGSATPPGKLSPARRAVLAAVQNGPASMSELVRATKVSAGVVGDMVKAGLLDRVRAPAARPPIPAVPALTPTDLSEQQQTAAASLREAAASRRFSVTLLQGATGSGKTEVYFEAVRACVKAGRQALILLPEIALSAQWLQRYEARFGVPPSVWHSDLGSKARRETWRSTARGHARVVVGARSALFLPFEDLGLVVVDEEHEAAFKQEDGVVYHARDMAVVRGRLCGAAVVLVSATPSLETVSNVEIGRYARLVLPVRFGGAVLPHIEAIDLRAFPPERGTFLSPVLIDAVEQTLARGEQAMLFLNRRGYAPLTLCRTCGHRFECPNCTAWLVEHRLRRQLVCHHCAHAIVVPPACPACGAADTLAPVGPGVERIDEEAARRFPSARRLIMASDTLPGPHAAAAAAAAIERRDVDLVIGTQVAAKGWHFPYLTLVGVVDADLGLAGGDLRAGERTMQLLHQVAGRAGRERLPGTVLLQTHDPGHPLLQSLIAGDLDGFLQAEAAQRRPGHWPPFGRLAALIVSAERAEDADRMAQLLGRVAPREEGAIVLGPAPAPLAVLRGRHRRRLLLRTTRDIAVQPLLHRWLAAVTVPRGVRIDVDVDPISFL